MRTELQDRILSVIPYGKENAIKREDLARLIDCKDRKIRQNIEDLRNDGEIICSQSSVNGYWKPTKRSEVESFEKEMKKRAINCFKASRMARKYLKNHDDQLHF